MAEYRPRNYGDKKLEIVNGKTFSAGQSQVYSSSFTHSQSYSEPPPNYNSNYNMKNTKSKSAKSWSFNDPEVKRRKEGRMKASFRKSFRWIKDKYTELVQGWQQ